MKTRYWILIILCVALLCAVLSVCFFFGKPDADTAYVYSDGKCVMVLDLQVDGQYRIDCADGWNLLSVRDGCVGVSAASCASQDCVRHGFASGGAPIVCLPHRLVIEFSSSAAYDALIG